MALSALRGIFQSSALKTSFEDGTAAGKMLDEKTVPQSFCSNSTADTLGFRSVSNSSVGPVGQSFTSTASVEPIGASLTSNAAVEAELEPGALFTASSFSEPEIEQLLNINIHRDTEDAESVPFPTKLARLSLQTAACSSELDTAQQMMETISLADALASGPAFVPMPFAQVDHSAYAAPAKPALVPQMVNSETMHFVDLEQSPTPEELTSLRGRRKCRSLITRAQKAQQRQQKFVFEPGKEATEVQILHTRRTTARRRKAKSLISLAQKAHQFEPAFAQDSQLAVSAAAVKKSLAARAEEVERHAGEQQGGCIACGANIQPHFKFCQYCGEHAGLTLESPDL